MRKPRLPLYLRKSRLMKVYLTRAEKETIKESAERAGLSVSEFARRAGLGLGIPSIEDRKARLELMKIYGDQGRMIGLLKQAKAFGHKEQIDRMIKNMEETREVLKIKIRNI